MHDGYCAPRRSDQGTGNSALKFKPGCSIPGHWHTGAENLVLVSGADTTQMRDGQPMTMKAGDYLYLAVKGIYRFTANVQPYTCDMPCGAIDIHSVDAAGNEIPPDKALAAPVKALAWLTIRAGLGVYQSRGEEICRDA